MHKYKVGDTGTYKIAHGIMKLTDVFVGESFTIVGLNGVSSSRERGYMYKVQLTRSGLIKTEVYESEMHIPPLIKRDIPWL